MSENPILEFMQTEPAKRQPILEDPFFLTSRMVILNKFHCVTNVISIFHLTVLSGKEYEHNMEYSCLGASAKMRTGILM